MITEDLDEVMVKFFERSVAHNKATGEPAPFDVAVENVILEGGKFKDVRPIIAETKEQKTLSPPPPIITSINPTSGPATGGTHVNIIGDRFLPSCTVNFDGDPEAPGGTFTDPQHIMAVTSAHSAGFVDVEVENVSGLSDELVNAFEFIGPPNITSVSPNRGNASGGSQVIINGTNFVYTTGYTVKFNTTTVSAVRLSATQLRCAVPFFPGSVPGSPDVPVNVVVTASDGQTSTLVNGYAYFLGFFIVTGVFTIHSGVVAGFNLITVDNFFNPDPTFNGLVNLLTSSLINISGIGIGPNPLVVGGGSVPFTIIAASPGSGSFVLNIHETTPPDAPVATINVIP